MEFNKFRVRSPVKSFRDLEVCKGMEFLWDVKELRSLHIYQKTIQLSSEMTSLSFLDDKERGETSRIAERIPQLIAEAYGDKYDSKELSRQKLTEAVTLVTNAITKIDLFREKFKEHPEKKEILDKLLSRYHTQKMKILNLRKAWDRVYLQKPP